MTQTNNRMFDDFAKLMTEAAGAAEGMKREAESMMRGQAEKFLRAGYERLLNYRDTSGGFTYWGRGEPDLALTAYALRFLQDAREFAEASPPPDAATATTFAWSGMQSAKVGVEGDRRRDVLRLEPEEEGDRVGKDEPGHRHADQEEHERDGHPRPRNASLVRCEARRDELP